jgi:molybdopterin molybdotransferase
MTHPEPPEPLVPVEEHHAEILGALLPLHPVRLPLAEADGSVLAEDVLAGTPLPSFDNSAMDGYAVRSADLARAAPHTPVRLPVRGEVPAGDTRLIRVEPGTVVRIMTGALLPAGADAVIPVELTDGGREEVSLHRAVPAGNAIRHRGDDVAEGTRLLASGTAIGAVELALLAAAGYGAVLARPRPRVAVISTGNELAEPGTPLVPGQIWESNSFMLAAAARQAGAVPHRYRVADDPDALLSTVDELLPDADLLITSGGVSMGGEHDVVKVALSKLGTVTFRKVAMQPGMPQGFGVLGPGRTPIFTLPGNPVSAYLSFLLFVRPALAHLQGRAEPRLRRVTAVLTRPARSPGGRRSYLRGRLDHAEETVLPLTGQSSHQLGALAQANALIVVPEPVTRLEEGDPVDVLCLP